MIYARTVPEFTQAAPFRLFVCHPATQPNQVKSPQYPHNIRTRFPASISDFPQTADFKNFQFSDLDFLTVKIVTPGVSIYITFPGRKILSCAFTMNNLRFNRIINDIALIGNIDVAMAQYSGNILRGSSMSCHIGSQICPKHMRMQSKTA